ncbi:MAG TPA: hypothetical protein VF939_09375 [Puia sp.]
MGLRDKSIQFIRRLSVFYLLLIVLLVCFGLYYFNYVPHNKSGLNEWGQRSLNQLAANFTQKSADIEDIFDSAIIDSLKNKRGSYRYLNSNIPYTLDRIYPDSPGKKNLDDDSPPSIGKDRTEQWCIRYPADSLKGDSVVLVRINDFLKPLLEGRDGIFDSYMLFRDSDPPGHNKPFNLEVLYRNEGLSASATINADTLLQSQKNSDLSGVVELSISGTVYEVFLRPFPFYQQHIYLAGLISKANYEKNAQSTPLNFIPYSIVLLLIIFINMPFLKIYLLSPKERINSRDVLSAALSFFAGSSLLVLIVFYIFINIFTKITFNHRLTKFGDRLHTDIETEFRLANEQLWQYDSIYSGLDSSQKKVLVYRQKNDSIKKAVNTAFIPSRYNNISRVFWIDPSGNTIAKWNPFNFDAPLSSVRNFDIFKIFQKQVPMDTSFANSEHNIIYTGKSNTTGEFQVYIAKPLRRPISDTGGRPVKSLNISLAVFLNSGVKPVIPAGFGFCLVDREGRILMDADEHRNLTENLLEETGSNPHLAHCLQYKNEVIIDNVPLYGQPCEMLVLPLHDQPLSVVVYYNKRLLTNNILRLLHFTMETLLYIFIALGICILLSGINSFFTPTRLRFRLNKIEWVRYSTANKNAYAFTKVYYWYLTILTTALFLVILLGSFDMRTLLYTSLVLPFYTVWAFVFSGIRAIPGDLQKFKKYISSFLKTEKPVLLAGLSILVCLILINFICLPFFKNDFHVKPGSIWLFFLFQALAILGLFLTRPLARKKETQEKIKERKAGKRINERDFSRPNYIASLSFAILLIGVLPTLGVLTYGFYSEKIQYKKNKLLEIAKSSEQRDLYLASKIIPAYKPSVRARWTGNYFDSLLFHSGTYLTERDSVIYSPIASGNPAAQDAPATGTTPAILPAPIPRNAEIADEPYTHFMDTRYIRTSQDYDDYTIWGEADDSSWQFYTTHDSLDWLNLSHKNKIAARRGYQFLARSSLQNPLVDFLNLPLFILLLFLLLTITFMASFNWLIKGTLDRLFLFRFTRDPAPDRASNLLMKFLALPELRPEIPATRQDLYKGFMELTAPEFSTDLTVGERETIILAHEQRFAPLYNGIWNSLSVEEQFILFDFCLDGYTNYKNRELLNKLMDKGILILMDDAFKPFSLSFRNYVLSQKNSQALNQFMAAGSAGGAWTSLRIPILTLVAVVAIFTAFTQNDFTNKLTAFLTSVLALFPLVLKFLENFRAGGGDKNKGADAPAARQTPPEKQTPNDKQTPPEE